MLLEEYSVGLNDTTLIVGSRLVPRALKYEHYSYVDIIYLTKCPSTWGQYSNCVSSQQDLCLQA